MPNTKTAKKQLQVSKRNQARNQHNKTVLKNAMKRAHLAIEAGEAPDEAKLLVSQAVKALHRSATRRIIKRQNASRHASRLMLAYNRVFAKPAVAQEDAQA